MRVDQQIELRNLLSDVSTQGIDTLIQYMKALEASGDYETIKAMLDAYPQIMEPYRLATANIATEYIGLTAPQLTVVTSSTVAEEAVRGSVLTAMTSQKPIEMMSGIIKRHIFDGFRDTITDTVDNSGTSTTQYARYASSTACGFCRLLATRSVGSKATFYSSEEAATRVVGRGKDMSLSDRRDRAAGRDRSSSAATKGRFIAGGVRTRGTQKAGERFHDHCRCIPVLVNDQNPYQPPAYIEKWNQDYIDARKLGLRSPTDLIRYLNDPTVTVT